ncbi:hypothetical protein AAVH_18088 [Aphelenchoides avenae]|nr:hypothetical protein AAVH_18088 [Aphelenchus avenae]
MLVRYLVQESEQAAAPTAKHIRELRVRVKQLTIQLNNTPASARAKETEDQSVSKAEFDALHKQNADLTKKNKQLLDDVDCTRTDRERKQEEMDQLRGQLDKLRAEKNANGAAKSAKKTKK